MALHVASGSRKDGLEIYLVSELPMEVEAAFAKVTVAAASATPRAHPGMSREHP